MFKKRPPEPKCGNCKLFNPNSFKCGVAILYEGKQVHLPVEPEDDCFFENEFIALDETGQEERWKPQVEQVRWWVEDERGKPSEKGVVKIEYPEGFFRETAEDDL